ncbi:hypothetical protein [Nocardia lasii]|uniref:DUF4282 domain-containing protein n=1 Tax=Nocardia lasii TaxID=1616107 RepID=A0ABW1JMR9_9NOCA
MKHPTLLAAWRILRVPLAMLITYVALHAVVVALSARHGFGSPDGLGLAFTATAAAVVVLRVLLLTVVPAVVLYRIAKYVVTLTISPEPPT